MNEDFTPLLVATPLYGATEPETVTFDESAIRPTTAFVYGQEPLQPAMMSADPLIPRATPAVEEFSDTINKPDGPVFRDVPFAILFLIQLGAMIFLGLRIAPKGYDMIDLDTIKLEMAKDSDTSEQDIQKFETVVGFMATYLQTYPVRILTCLLCPTAFVAFLFALIITTKIIRPFPKFMVTLCLVGWFISLFILMGLFLITSFSIISLTIAVGVLAVTAYYIRASWRLIPHSSVNLGVSLEGVQANCGIYIVALFLAETGFTWTFYWFYTVVGTMIYIGETQCPDMEDSDDCGPQGVAFMFMLLSAWWTSQVITNLIQVTVAGVMATWCFDYDFARNCCSSAVWSSLYRSLTFSFGSICFGSLLMTLVRVLRSFIQSAKKQRENRADACDGADMFLCCMDCLIKLFEEVLEYFNHWSYVYCGIYGYSYLQSGRMVYELFRARGWENIVTDDLIGSVLNFTIFSVGVLTGLASMGLERIVDSHIEPDPFDAENTERQPEEWEINKSFLFGPIPHPEYLALFVGFFIGVIVCSIMMSVVRGAVNTLIVCWADSPSRLEANHPNATKDLADTWTTVFPEARVHMTSPLGLPAASQQHVFLGR